MSGTAEQKGVFQRFLNRAKNLMLSPRAEWQAIKEEQTTYRNIITGYVAIVAAIPPGAAIAERFVFGREIVSNAVHSPITYVLAANIVWYWMIIFNVIVTGAVITVVAGRNRPEWTMLQGLKLAAYSFTPSFLVCILIVIPKLNSLVYIAMAYSVYLLYQGVRSITEVGQGKAVRYTIASFFAAGLIVGGLNMFEYMVESFVASKVFF